MYPGPGQAGVANTAGAGAATTTGAGATTTGAATTGTGSGTPNEKPKLTPAWADTAATPIKVAARSTLVFINFIFLIFFFISSCGIRRIASPTFTENLAGSCRRKLGQ